MRYQELNDWIARYEHAWRSPGTTLLDELFTEEAIYIAAPFAEPVRGRDAIGEFWENERDGPEESFDLSWDPVAIEGDVGVVRVEVHYAGPPPRRYRDLWIVTLEQSGRCRIFEEWPFFPGQSRTAPG